MKKSYVNCYDYGMETPTEGPSFWALKQIARDSKVLEFGPSTGRLTKAIQQLLKCTVDIVEIDEVTGRNAKKYANRALIGKRDGDIDKMRWLKQLSRERYDTILFIDVLEHLRDPQAAILAAKRLLKQDGAILASIPNLAHNGVLISLINDRFSYQPTGLLDRTHIHFFAWQEIVRLAHENGFVVTEITPLSFQPDCLNLGVDYDQVSSDFRRALQARPNGLVVEYLCRFCLCGREVELISKPHIATLYYSKTGQDFCESQKECCNYAIQADGSFQIELPIPPDYEQLRIVLIKGQYISVCFDSDISDMFEIIRTNASNMENEGYVFFHMEPTLIIRLKRPCVQKIRLSGKIGLLSSDDLARELRKQIAIAANRL